MKRLAMTTCLCLVAWMLSVQPAEAGRRWRFTPSVSVKTTYNDNIQYLGKGDLETAITPKVRFNIDSERTQHTVTLGITHYKHAEHDEFDRTNQDYSLETVHQATERLTLIGKAGWGQDYTVGTIEEETGEVGVKTRRELLSLSGRAQYLLNERTVVGLNYGFSSRQYVKDYVDTVGHSLSGDIAWSATERLTLRGAVSTGTVESEFQDGGSGDYRSIGLSTGFRYELTEIYAVFADVGRRWSENDLDTGSVDEVLKDSGMTASGGVEWEFERSKGRLTYSRDTTTSLTGSTLDRDSLSLLHAYRTTERSALEFRADMTASQSDSVLSKTDNRYWSAGANWRYDLTEDHHFWIGATHYESENLITKESNERNSYYIRFDFNFPQEWTLGGARY